MIRKVLRWVICLVALGVFLYSGSQLYGYWKEAQEITGITERLEAMAVTTLAPQGETGTMTQTATAGTTVSATETVSGEETLQEEAVEVLEQPPIAVDFDTLWQENPDIVAWIYSPDTPISYPVVQSSNNSYYLRRALDGSSNRAGTIFLDYRSAKDLSDWETIIYGHNMKNDSMFGTLVNYQDQSYYEAHPSIYLLTPTGNYRLDLLAGYVTKADSSLYVPPQTQEERDVVIQEAMAASAFQTQADPGETGHLVLLSTCSYEYENARFVVLGVLRRMADTP